MLKIISVGTGTPDTLTLGALGEISRAEKVVLQTDKVPVAEFLKEYGIKYETIDDIFEAAEDFDELLRLVSKRVEEGVFCILGDVFGNLIAQEVLKNHPQAQVVGGVGFFSNALNLCKLPCEGAQFFTASSFNDAYFETDKPVVVTEVDSPYKAADAALKLSRFTDGDVYVIFGQKVEKMNVCDINWLPDEAWSYNCAIVMPALGLKEKQAYTFRDLNEVMDVLRGENGCPWDKKQTHRTLRKYLLEEALEAVEAIDEEDDFALSDELGDVLFQIAFHARIGKEMSSFDNIDVTTDSCKKMIKRHTHIFGAEKINTADGVSVNWEKIKREEKQEKTVYDSVSDATTLSALMRAEKVLKKAALYGIGENDINNLKKKLVNDLGALLASAEAGNEKNAEKCGGELLFDAVNYMRLLGLSAETALYADIRDFLSYVKQSES